MARDRKNEQPANNEAAKTYGDGIRRKGIVPAGFQKKKGPLAALRRVPALAAAPVPDREPSPIFCTRVAPSYTTRRFIPCFSATGRERPTRRASITSTSL